MATAAHAEAVVDAAPKSGSKKKLIILAAAVVLLLAVAGGGAMYFMKKKAAEAAAAAADGEGDGAEHAPAKAEHGDPHAIPTFVPLDPFTVNLADKDAERYAQVGITLELDEPHTADRIKAYMPAIRNAVLLVLAQKTAAELLERSGKEKLARELARESTRAMGVDVDEEPADAAPAADADKGEHADGEKKPKAKKKHVATETPIKKVHFANFIIQ